MEQARLAASSMLKDNTYNKRQVEVSKMNQREGYLSICDQMSGDPRQKVHQKREASRSASRNALFRAETFDNAGAFSSRLEGPSTNFNASGKIQASDIMTPDQALQQERQGRMKDLSNYLKS